MCNFLRSVLGSGAMFGPDHLAGLRNGMDHQAWVPSAGAGAFGASPTQALGGVGDTNDYIQDYHTRQENRGAGLR